MNRIGRKEMFIVLAGKPIPKQRPRVVKGHAYNPQAQLEESLHWDAYYQVKDQHTKNNKHSWYHMATMGAVGLSFIFFMPIPSSWSKKKKAEHYGQPHTSKADIDNFLKLYMDVLHNVLYEDDKQVYKVVAEKRYISEGMETRTEIEVI